MGFYSFNYPSAEKGTYTELIPTIPRLSVVRLSDTSSRATSLDKCSIQAVASANVKVRCWVSNFFNLPYPEKSSTVDEHGNTIVQSDIHNTDALQLRWDAPPITEDGFGRKLNGLWFPCESISDFTINGGVAYFKQLPFDDVARFLLFQFIAEYPAGGPVDVDISGVPVATVGFSFNITFR